MSIDSAFAAALEQDASLTETGPAEIAPPPRKPTVVDPDAPHGRGEDGKPNAPYGIGKNGKPRIKPAGPGRKPTGDDKPRVAAAAPVSTPAAATGTKDYSGDLDDLGDGLWMLVSGIPAPGAIGIKLNAQAALFHAHKTNLVKAANVAAQHHEGTAKLVEKLTSGNAAWALPVMFALSPFVAQSASLWRTPAEELAALAAKNQAEFKAMLTMAIAEAEEGESE